jgi:hypothetical protein
VASTLPPVVRVAVPVAVPSVPALPVPPSAKNAPAGKVSLSPVRLPPGRASDGPLTAAFHTSRMCLRSTALPPSATRESPTWRALSQTSPAVR